jgi:GH15 family glucan-1,4-alpha-glucosidase
MDAHATPPASEPGNGQPAPEKPLPIEDYALIGDCASAAIVGRNGSVDWLCLPRFDSGACFAALLGDSSNGRWKIAPVHPAPRVTRSYRGDSLVLETVFETDEGRVAVIDLMPRARRSASDDVPENSSLVRIVEGRRGRVAMTMELGLRFDYGSSVPWVTALPSGEPGLVAVVGPEMVVLRTPVKLEGRHLTTFAEFTVGEGERVPFVLTHGPSHRGIPPALEAGKALEATEEFWRDWSGRCKYQGPYHEPVLRSLLTLKALTYAPTGGIAAAATTSLPEQLGGTRNWDYRFCWLRDATITLLALMHGGYYEEAGAWRDWLHRAIAGSPEQVQIMYGLSGERRLAEWEVPWLPGYESSSPVRIGNAAADQLQLDVYGEVMDALHFARDGGLVAAPESWDLQRMMVEHLEAIWSQPDEGIWETRAGRVNFTYSKVMCWVALDRSVRDAEAHGLDAPLERWKALRDEIHATICREGFSTKKNSFVQSFGSQELDASLLLIPQVGFLPATDERVHGTILAIRRELMDGGFVLRYRTDRSRDGLPPGEGAFLACSFWLADCLNMIGHHKEAHEMFERLLALRNDVGLLSEEYDPGAKRLVGNFPQAFSHVSLIGTALNLTNGGPAKRRGNGRRHPKGVLSG